MSRCCESRRNNSQKQAMPTITALLVDDNSIFLDSASRFLEADERIKIVGRALSGSEALTQVEQLRPDVVVMDVAMPGMNGLDATRHLKSVPDSPLVVIATMHDHDEMRAAVKEVQADGFVPKSRFCLELPGLIKNLFDQRNASAISAGAQ